MGKIQSTFNDKYEEYMQNFLCRLLRHDFVVSYINDFFNQNERTYYSFFMLMKVLGAHANPKFQTNYWSDCYIYFYEKLGIHGILFIPLLLSKGTTDDKKKIIKKYLNEHINNTKEKITINSNLVINLLEFKKVILTYISCVSTRGLENVIKALDNDPKEAEFLKRPDIKNEIKDYRLYYSNQLVESFVDILLRPYSRQNYYVNAGKFIDDNIDFLTDDKNIRQRLREFSKNQSDISKEFEKTNKQFANINSLDLNNKLEQIDIKTREIENLEKFKNIKDTSDIGEDKDSNKNKKINKSPIINSNSIEPNELSRSIIKNVNNNPINNNGNILTEKMFQSDSFSVKGKGKENNDSNNLLVKNKNQNKNNNLANLSFKMGDWEVKKENVVRPLINKGNNNINNSNNNTNNITNNNINNNKANFKDNDSFSFDESFKQENIPKKID